MNSPGTQDGLLALRETWLQAWPGALEVWSRFVQLHEPQWCFTIEDEQREQLAQSFAMIRLVDHSIVISLRQVQAEGLQRFAKEVLAHEIGHHVYCPADLTDNTRLLARIRRGLPTLETQAPMISNLYSDLLINDRLQRTAELDMVGVYQQLGVGSEGRLWTLYMRIYEVLWRLPRQSLTGGQCDVRLNQDAQLGARLIRSYAQEWLGGAGRFAALCLPYLLEDDQRRLERLARWADTRCAGRGGFPNGIVEVDDEEALGAIHPAEDPELSGIDDLAEAAALPATAGQRHTPPERSGRKSIKNFRQPFEYAELLKEAGVDLDERDITARYYREMALPHLVPFPVRKLPQTTDPLPEGLEQWDVAAPLEQIDWLGTFLASTRVVPGVTTRQRLYGDSPGSGADVIPQDLYLGIDCSGSMGDPAHRLSYPVLAGAIIALSALRVGAKVKVVLSGEPGKTIATAGFIREQRVILRTLASYLGTGYSFGIHRLAETFVSGQRQERPTHILIVSDNDMFRMLEEHGNQQLGWDVAAAAARQCNGGATFVLQLPAGLFANNDNHPARKYLTRMQEIGWHVNLVDSMEQLVSFARDFAHRKFDLQTNRRP